MPQADTDWAGGLYTVTMEFTEDYPSKVGLGPCLGLGLGLCSLLRCWWLWLLLFATFRVFGCALALVLFGGVLVTTPPEGGKMSSFQMFECGHGMYIRESLR